VYTIYIEDTDCTLHTKLQQSTVTLCWLIYPSPI